MTHGTESGAVTGECLHVWGADDSSSVWAAVFQESYSETTADGRRCLPVITSPAPEPFEPLLLSPEPSWTSLALQQAASPCLCSLGEDELSQGTWPNSQTLSLTKRTSQYATIAGCYIIISALKLRKTGTEPLAPPTVLEPFSFHVTTVCGMMQKLYFRRLLTF